MTIENADEYFRMRNGVNIYPAQDKAIELVLAELLQLCPAQFVLLADQSGQLITVQGERGTADLASLASLVAADLAASQEIARQAGQYQSCQLVLREGQQAHIFISEAGKNLVLFVLVSKQTPLGWARLLIFQTAAKLAEIIARPPEDVELMDLELNQEDKFFDLFDSALDAVWTKDDNAH